jgi:hypothetical protein
VAGRPRVGASHTPEQPDPHELGSGAPDFVLLRNGNYLLLVRRPVRGTDFLLEVDRSREEVWRWEAPKVGPATSHRAEPIEDADDPEVLEHQRRQLEALGYVN